MQDLMRQPDCHPGFSLKKGRLYFKHKVEVPTDSSKIPLILKEFHDLALCFFIFFGSEGDTEVTLKHIKGFQVYFIRRELDKKYSSGVKSISEINMRL